MPSIIPIANEHPLSSGQRATLRLLAGLMIPASARHGVPGLFHVTVTEAWMRVVEGAMADDTDDAGAFDNWVAAHPDLLDGALLHRYFSDDLIRSDAARSSWVEPDRDPLPTD